MRQVLISKDETVAGRVVEHVKGLEAEVNVLKHLDHPNIVRYLVRTPSLAQVPSAGIVTAASPAEDPAGSQRRSAGCVPDRQR